MIGILKVKLGFLVLKLIMVLVSFIEWCNGNIVEDVFYEVVEYYGNGLNKNVDKKGFMIGMIKGME